MAQPNSDFDIQAEMGQLQPKVEVNNEPIRRPNKASPGHQGPKVNLIEVHLPSLRVPRQPQPRTPTHYEPSDSVPGRLRLPGVQRPILARLRRAAGRLYGRRQAMQFSSLLDN